MNKVIVNEAAGDRFVICDARINKKKERPVYWFFEPIGGDNVKLKWLPRQHRAGMGINADPRSKTMTTPDGTTMEQFLLSVCGLDKFKVFAACKRDGSDKKTQGEYEVWRKLYYSTSAMPGMMFNSYGPVEAEYKRHGIDLDRLGGITVPYQGIVERRNALDRLFPRVQKRKIEAQLLFVNRLWASEWIVRSDPVGGLSGSISMPKYIWPSATDFPHLRGETGGTYNSKFIEGNLVSQSLNYSVPLEDYVTRRGETDTFQYNFTSIPYIRAAKAEGRAGDLKMEYRIKLVSYLNGTTRSNGRILIARRSRPSDVGFRPDSEIQKTIVHEIGHGLGMVPERLQEYNEFNGNPIRSALHRNPHWYNPGSGNHCKNGAARIRGEWTNGPCVLFHYSHPRREIKFCGACTKIVRRRNLGAEDADGPELAT